ncbi:hypothetical protein HN865_04695, partial [Candidatus Woesearchaeota archaeon]|nr:hypothetical protein [Candidatus Woesearchaeota archaeon]
MKIKRGDLLLVTIIFIILVYFFPQIEVQHSPILIEDQNAMLFQPYKDKIIYARSNISDNFTYEWYVNGELKENKTSHTIFLAHFDNSLITTEGEFPMIIESESFENGKFSQGFSGVAEYSTINNINFDEGTIEFWLTLKEPLNSTVFDDFPNIFYYNNPSGQEYLTFKVYGDDDLYFTIYEEDWSNSTHINTRNNPIKVGEPMHFTMAYSKTMNRSSLYFNGFKISSGKYDYDLNSLGNFKIGNINVIIDEFRILDRSLSNQEVLASYSLGIPFSANDLYLNEKLIEDDIIKINVVHNEITYTEELSTKKQLIQNLNPSGPIIKNTNEINFNFKTEQSVFCGYSNTPKPFSELSIFDTSQTIDHQLNIPVQNTINYKNIYIKCQDDKNSFFKRVRILPKIKENYPKIAAFKWGSNIQDYEVYNLSKYDLLAVSRGNLDRPLVLEKIREYNNNIIILPYHLSIGIQSFGGFYQDDIRDRVNDSMRLQNVEGDFAVYPSNTGVYFYNLFIENQFSTVYSEHIAEDIIPRGDYDGMWFDNAGNTFWFLKNYTAPGFPYTIYPDINMDGENENLDDYDTSIIAQGYWGEGINKLLNLITSKIGEDALIVGNAADKYPGNYEGKVWEGKLEHWQGGSDDGPVNTFLEYSNTTYMGRSFPYWNKETASPHLNWNLFTNEINKTSNPLGHYTRHRLGIAASIIGEVYYDPEMLVEGDREFEWYDEYWVDPITSNPTNNSDIGSGYLGTPISESTINNSIWRKDFQNGIVLLNQNYTQKTIGLEKIFRYINGTEAPTINKGGFTNNNITIRGKDGIILLRSLCSDNPSNDPNCISICGDDICGTSETCSSCSQDCGECDDTPDPGDNGNTIIPPPSNNTGCTENCEEESETINQINLDNDNVVEIDVSGGQYVIISGGINSIINVYNINEILITLIYGGN